MLVHLAALRIAFVRMNQQQKLLLNCLSALFNVPCTLLHLLALTRMDAGSNACRVLTCHLRTAKLGPLLHDSVLLRCLVPAIGLLLPGGLHHLPVVVHRATPELLLLLLQHVLRLSNVHVATTLRCH